MKVLMTGSSGFVGQNLVPYLIQNGFELQKVKREPSLQNEISYEHLLVSPNHENDAFIHLAGKAHDLKNSSKAEDYFEINTTLTEKLYDNFIKSNANIFIFLSSVKAAADSLELPLDEFVEPHPATAYGQSKLDAENYILKNYSEINKRVYILRPSIIHGPGNKGNLNLLFKMVSKGWPWPLGDFDNRRSFCSIQNLCFVVNELLKRNDIPSGIYNVADNEPISTNELISIIAKAQNKSPRIYKIPKAIINLSAKIGNALRLPLTTNRLKKLTDSYMVKNTKLVNALGKPLPVDSRAGLMSTFNSFTS